ncbi:hypothetical protein LSAT2_012631 [Lamellibrachia satsuma]|nr:hypothetical protein LSAT2_012631 [Lamellibrachia satsuma]
MPAPNREKFRYRPPPIDHVTPRISPAASAPDQYVEWQKAKAGRGGKANPFNYRWSPPQKNIRLDTLGSSECSLTPRRGVASDGDTRDMSLLRFGTFDLIGPSPTMVLPHPLPPAPTVKPPGVSVQTFEMPQLCRPDVAAAPHWPAVDADASTQPAKVVYRTGQDQETLRQQKASVVTLSLQKNTFGPRREPPRQLSVDDPGSTLGEPAGPTPFKMSSLSQKRAADPTSRNVRLSGSGRPFLGRFNKLDVFSERGYRISLGSPVPSPRNGGDTNRRLLAPPPTYRTVDSQLSGSHKQEWQQQQHGAMMGRKLPQKMKTLMVDRSDASDSTQLSYWNAFAGQRGGSDRMPVVGDLVAGSTATLCGQRYGQAAPFGSNATENARGRRKKKPAHREPPDNAAVEVDRTADLCRWARAAIAAHDNDDDIDDDTKVPSPDYGVMT